MEPLTQVTPKALIPVAGEPFLIHQLRLLSKAGFRRIVLCVGHLGQQIEARIGNGSGLGLRVEYSCDGPLLLGTGGAIKHALCKLGDQFGVLYGDSYLPMNYQAVVEAFVRSSRPALMTVFRNRNQWETSNVFFEGGTVHLYDKKVQIAKMQHIEYGFAMLTAAVFSPYPDDQAFDLAEVYRRLIAQGEMAAYEVKERFYEIGSKQGLAELDALLQNRSTGLKS